MFLAIGVFAFYSRYLPNPTTLLYRSSELSTKLLDKNGKPIYEVYGEKNRELVTLNQVSPNVISATLAVEDSGFYLHQGYDLRGMLRAVKNMALGGNIQSGSTITQQVVKNALLTQEQTISRKIKELILSLQLENKYSKDEILQMYLNETPYGGQNYGILTAARSYFDKHPSELTVAEAAFLAGLPQSPTTYSPFGSNPELGYERKDYVLYLMNERGWVDERGTRHYLSDDEYEEARVAELKFQTATTSFKAPHFVFYVKQLLAEKYGENMVEQGGLQVITSLDLDIQEMAQTIVKEEVEKAASLNVGNGAFVAIDPQNGQILAMVGSKDYFADPAPEGCVSGITGENSCVFDPKVNVTLAKRQPGSSIKPITYATMLKQGYTAAFPFLDVPTNFKKADAGKDYEPENYDGEFRGPMSLRKSLGNSINVPAVKAMKIVSVESMIETAQDLGISTFTEPDRYGLSLTLGGGETKLLEMTNAFATFAARGIYHEPVAILEVKDAKGKTIYKWRDNGGTQALGEDIAFLISDILSDDGARSEVFGFGSLLNIPGHQVAVKTGTTDDKRDNYAIGYTPFIVAGTWVGNSNNEEMDPYLSSGITGATPIWNRFMREYLADKEDERFEPSENVQKMEVDTLTGMLPYKDFEKRAEWFIKGTEPTAPSPWYMKLEICKPDGKLASDACRKADQTKEKDFIKITAELPEWQDDVDAWVKENYNDDSKYFPPSTVSHLYFDEDGDPKEDGDPYVEVLDFDDGDKVPLEFRLKVEVSSPHTITKVKIYMDDDLITTDTSIPYGYDFTFSLSETGEHEFEVKAEDSKGKEGETKIKLNVQDI